MRRILHLRLDPANETSHTAGVDASVVEAGEVREGDDVEEVPA